MPPCHPPAWRVALVSDLLGTHPEFFSLINV